MIKALKKLSSMEDSSYDGTYYINDTGILIPRRVLTCISRRSTHSKKLRRFAAPMRHHTRKGRLVSGGSLGTPRAVHAVVA